MIYFTADLHLGHENIIKYCKRPFSDAKQMDEVLISNWNHVVSPSDTVYVIGDFCRGKPGQYLDRLNGRIFLVPGDHDKKCRGNWVLPPIVRMRIVLQEGDGYQKVTLCHYPMLSWPMSHYGSWLLYGHNHSGNLPFELGKAMNVGVDLNNYIPVSWRHVVQYMSHQPNTWNLVSTKRNICASRKE